MEVRSTRNREVLPYLLAGGVFSTFPLYVCQQKPESYSPCGYSDEGIQGCAVTGRDCGLEWIHPYWLMATSKPAALLLLKHLKDALGDDVGLNFPLEFHDEVRDVFPGRDITVDHLYVLVPSRFREREAIHPVRVVTEELLSRVNIPDDMVPLIGSDHKMYNGIPFFGTVIDNRLVAIAEAICDTGTYAAIQQVYTATTCRGQGLGSIIVSSVAASLIRRSKTPVYWVSEDNDSSIHLVRKLGFELAMRLGCIDG